LLLPLPVHAASAVGSGPDDWKVDARYRERMASLSGRRAWITGASSGIGAATARALAANGAEVVLTARREDRLRALAAELPGSSIEAGNVADRAAMERIGAALEAKGGVDILIANAGLMPLSPIVEGRADEWERMIDVNVKGLLWSIRAVYPGMARRRRGHIVTIGSVAGRFSNRNGAVYSGTKFAVRAIADGLRKEALEFKVRVTDIEPGAVATELPESIRHEASRKAAVGPGGVYGPGLEILQAEDVANAVLYAVTQPEHVNVSELLLRPRTQER
jgi:NADP-dependent 3-hydroxy acid dehydrogenase YdfG